MNYILQKDTFHGNERGMTEIKRGTVFYPHTFYHKSWGDVVYHDHEAACIIPNEFIKNTEWFKPEEVERTTQMSYTQYLKNRTNETNNSDNSASIN